MSENEEYCNARRESGDRMNKKEENTNGKKMGNRMERNWKKEKEWNWKEGKQEKTPLIYQSSLL